MSVTETPVTVNPSPCISVTDGLYLFNGIDKSETNGRTRHRFCTQICTVTVLHLAGGPHEPGSRNHSHRSHPIYFIGPQRQPAPMGGNLLPSRLGATFQILAPAARESKCFGITPRRPTAPDTLPGRTVYPDRGRTVGGLCAWA